MGVVRSGQQQWIQIQSSIYGKIQPKIASLHQFQALSYYQLSISVNSKERQMASKCEKKQTLSGGKKRVAPKKIKSKEIKYIASLH